MARAREQVERRGDFLTVGEAAEYLGVSEDGPYKPDYYRY